MEVAEQQQHWQKQEEEVEETEEEVGLQGRGSRKLAAASAAVGVSFASSVDEMLPSPDPVNEPQEEESRHEELLLDGNMGGSDVELDWQQKSENEAVSGDEMLPSLEPVDGFQEQEEPLQSGIKVELNSQQKSEKNVYNDEGEGTYIELDWQQKSENEAGNGDEMLPSLEPIDGCQEQEELLQSGSKVELKYQQKSEKNVYYDEDEGMWKCRNCCWTYQSGSPWIDHTQHSKWYLHMLMNPKTVNQWEQCFFCETEGTESISRCFVTKSNGMRGSASEKNLGDEGLVATITNEDSQRDDSLSGFGLQPPEKPSEEDKTIKSFRDTTEASHEIELIKEIDKELTELDVERVLEKQDTHDLYCPNCNSCITRKVILRKRKHKIQISGDDLKRNKLETVVASELEGISADATNEADISPDATMEPAASDNSVREPEIFRCLSCFSFIIPSGKGFKLFKIFGHKSMQSPQPISAVKKNWLPSLLASTNEQTSIAQGSCLKAYAEESTVGASEQEVASPPLSLGAQAPVQSSTTEAQNGGAGIVPPSTQGPKMLGEYIAGDIVEKGTDMGHQLDSASRLNEMLWTDGTDQPATQLAGTTPVSTKEPAVNVLFKPRQDADDKDSKLTKPVPVLGESFINEKVNTVAGFPSENGKDGAYEDSKLTKPCSALGESDITEKVNILADFPSENGQKVAATLPIGSVVEARNVEVTFSETTYSSAASQHAIFGTKVDVHVEETLKSSNSAISLSRPDGLLFQDTQVNITNNPAKSSASDISLTTSSRQGGDTIITIKGGHAEPAGPQEAQDTVTSAETVPLIHTESAEARGFPGLEIIKSVVYGGLMESIASVGIVSSAAAADASTLNILALGLANLVGGLFVIFHNLWELKNNQSEVASDQVTTRLDRYQELLGQRQNFLLHATVAILSFLIFGLIPPVVYSFSFRVSDNTDYKLIAVAAASLLCIIILAIGKAYVKRPPKFYIKTVIYYVVTGFMASGLSYAVGDLIKKLMDKLGWFDSTLTMNILGTTTTTAVMPAWGSY